MEEWGSGYQRSVSYCKQHSYPEPVWKEFGSTIRVTFASHPSFVANILLDVPVDVPVDVPINERQKWFIDQLSLGNKLKSPDIVKRWQVNEKTAKRDIAELKKIHIIEFIGSPKTGYYALITK